MLQYVQKSNGENLSSPSLETFQLSVQSVCPMFNAGSMLYRLKALIHLFDSIIWFTVSLLLVEFH